MTWPVFICITHSALFGRPCIQSSGMLPFKRLHMTRLACLKVGTPYPTLVRMDFALDGKL
jgi:hypothetical protein